MAVGRCSVFGVVCGRKHLLGVSVRQILVFTDCCLPVKRKEVVFFSCMRTFNYFLIRNSKSFFRADGGTLGMFHRIIPAQGMKITPLTPKASMPNFLENIFSRKLHLAKRMGRKCILRLGLPKPFGIYTGRIRLINGSLS